MAENPTEQVRFRINRAMLAQLDARTDQEVGITRSDVIRQLLQSALVASSKKV